MTHADEFQFLRHALATLAYRAGKVLRDYPQAGAERRLAPTMRTPLELVGHLADLMEWGESLAHGESRWNAGPALDWSSACERFFRGLEALDRALADADPRSRPPGQIFQGPVADALTHVGQLALLRGALGSAVRPESYARAEIQVGHVGREQPPPAFEFDGDASRPKRERG
jgi:hypothetical protein